MDPIVWLEFIFIMALLMIIARKSLWAGLIISALLLGILSLSPSGLFEISKETIGDPSVILLSVSVGIIAVIGGSMEATGQINDLVDNTRLRKKITLFGLPALMGMLPIPGGALLSAPVVDRAAPEMDRNTKMAINVWARHAFLLIYPLGALVAICKMADLDLYTIVLYMVPWFLISVGIAYIFLLRSVNGRTNKVNTSWRKLVGPLGVILVAPLIHALLSWLFPGMTTELFLLLGVLVSLALVSFLGSLRGKDIGAVAVKMRAWNFSLIILGIFLFLNFFNASEIPGEIGDLNVSMPILLVVFGSVLGFLTGRINVPVSILIPIFVYRFGGSALTPVAFSIMFFATLMGYILSPVHPCVSVSLEYFRTDFTGFLRKLLAPALIGILIAYIAAMVLL